VIQPMHLLLLLPFLPPFLALGLSGVHGFEGGTGALLVSSVFAHLEAAADDGSDGAIDEGVPQTHGGFREDLCVVFICCFID